MGANHNFWMGCSKDEIIADLRAEGEALAKQEK